MVEEILALDQNEAWDLVDLLVGRKPIGNKWAFKKNLNVEGTVEKYNTRLVAKGYSQVYGISFDDMFSLVAKLAYIIFILFVVVAFVLVR